MRRTMPGSISCWLLVAGCLATFSALAPADEFTYIDEKGDRITIDARLIGSGQGFQALERVDGQIQIVPTGAIQQRQNSGDPEPVDRDELAALIRKRFGEDLTRIVIERQYVVALVLAAPLESSAEGRTEQLLEKAARFMNNVDGVFEKYARSMRFPLRDSRFPLALVIFESDEDFNQYADEATGGRGLSAEGILGFYSALTNWLAVRLSSCDSFEVPLHEAIHQQVYNRLFARLAPIPKWFDEGIATGFEGDGERIDSNPAKVNSRYAKLAIQLPPDASWASVIGNDQAFNADILAGNAYTMAWCLHWMLATRHEDNYRRFVDQLAKREPLGVLKEKERIAGFEEIFGVSTAELQAEFPLALKSAVRRQHVNLTEPPSNGTALEQQALGQYAIQAVRLNNLGGQIQVRGTIRNVSPLRPLSFYVTVETLGGLYADWFIPELRPNQQIPLSRQVISKPIPGTFSGSVDAYKVYVRSAPSQGEQAREWSNGNLPGPVTADR